MHTKHSNFVLWSILILALLLRLAAVSWNDFPHADVGDDVKTAVSLGTKGTLMVEELPKGAVPEPFFYDVAHFGGKLQLQHPPLWPILGAFLVKLSGQESSNASAYLAFKILSFIAGMALLVVSFFVAKRTCGNRLGVAFVLCMTLSFVLNDYAGNGSFYSAHALLYLLWILVALSHIRGRVFLLGAIAGIAYLINYQAMVLALATPLLIVLWDVRSVRKRLGDAAIAMLVFLALISPWLIRNWILFGKPLIHNLINMDYVWSKAGIHPIASNGILAYRIGLPEYSILIKKILTEWFPNNLYYIARKCFVLMPGVFLLVPFACIAYLFEPARRYKMIPVLLPLLLHVLLAAAWPVTKFRFFVPMLPLVLLIALEHFHTFHWSLRQKQTAVLIVATLFALTFLRAYIQIPTHTFYYDGAVTTDPFSGSEEMRYIKEHGYL